MFFQITLRPPLLKVIGTNLLCRLRRFPRPIPVEPVSVPQRPSLTGTMQFGMGPKSLLSSRAPASLRLMAEPEVVSRLSAALRPLTRRLRRPGQNLLTALPAERTLKRALGKVAGEKFGFQGCSPHARKIAPQRAPKYGFRYLHASETASLHRKEQYAGWFHGKVDQVLARARQIIRLRGLDASRYSCV